MKTLNKAIGVTAVMGILCMCGTAQATTALNIAGVGQVDTLDWSPGSAYAQGGSAGTSILNFPVYFQSSLGNYQYNNNVITGTGLNSSYWITLVAGFHEAATIIPLGTDGTLAAFSGVAGQPSYVEIYKTNMAPNALTGYGYAPGTAQAGQTFTSLLTATVDYTSIIGTFFSPYSINPQPGGYGILDGANDDDWSGQLTVPGSGGTTLDAQVQTYLNTFFLDSIDVLTFELLSGTQNNTPFTHVDPSQMVYDGFTNNPLVTVGTLGTVNGNVSGSGTGNILFESDASSSFQATVVPEPSTFVLSGLGLILAGGLLRRRRGNK